MKLVHAADLHLDSPLAGLDRYEGAPVEEFQLATRRAMENLVALCVDEGAALLLIAGDVYDGAWKDARTGQFFAKQMVTLHGAGVRVVIVRGNHDAESVVARSVPLPDNVHLLSTRAPETLRFDDLGLAVHGQSFAERAVRESLAAAYPPAIPGLCNIGVLHTSLNGRPGHDDYAPATLDVLKSRGYQYWALGHVHQREVVCEHPWVVFPGNLQGRHARETGAKGATLVTVRDDHIEKVEARALDVVRWGRADVDLVGAGNEEQLLARARGAMEQALALAERRPLALRLRFVGATPLHGRLAADEQYWREQLCTLGNEVGNDALWIEKIERRTSDPASFDAAALAARDDVLGELVAAIDALRGDAELARPYFEALADLRGKLPGELREGPDGLPLDDVALVTRCLDDVQDLLWTRLMTRSETP